MPKRKLILTHQQNLRKKYADQHFYQAPDGGDDLACLLHGLQAWMDFDASRGIESTLVYLDGDPNLGSFRVPPNPRPEDYKTAVDAAYNFYQPDYMVIFGGSDLVPFVPLDDPRPPPRNRFPAPPIPSDLPYACGGLGDPVKFPGHQITDYLNPCRRISRLPDVEGNSEMGSITIMRTLEHTLHPTIRHEDNYAVPWAVCSQMRSTPMRMTLDALYQNRWTDGSRHVPVRYSPPEGPRWTTADYQRLLHIHIVHGGEKRNRLFGEDVLPHRPHPPAISANSIDQNIRPGTVVLERACYGGQLYNPAAALPSSRESHRNCFVNMYLSSGAACMLGSTTYNTSNLYGMLLGDLLVARFFNFLPDHTVGDAFLRARHAVLNGRRLTNCDLGMYAGFQLYGDVSAMPIGNPWTGPHANGGGGNDGNDGSGGGADEETASDSADAEKDGVYPLTANAGIELAVQMKEAIGAYLLEQFQIKSIDSFYCSRVMQNGKIVSERMQITAYTQDPGTYFERAVNPEDPNGANPGEERLKTAAPDGSGEAVFGEAEKSGIWFTFEIPGTDGEPFTFLGGCVMDEFPQ